MKPKRTSLPVNLAAEGQKYGISVTTHPEARVEANRVELTTEGLLEFDANCMLRPFLLVSEGEEFALLEEGDYYYLLAGPSDFVTAVAGGNLRNAWDSFKGYAASFESSRPERRWLLDLLDRHLEAARR